MQLDRRVADEILSHVLALAAAFRQVADEATQAAYLIGLGDVPLADVRRSIEMAIRTEDFMPSVARLRKIAGVDVSSKTRAIMAFDALGKAIQFEGSYRSIVFDDPILNATVNSLGGWVAVCETPEAQWDSFFRHRFIETYSANFEARRGTMHAQLGIADRQNGGNGFEMRQPTLIATDLPKIPGLTYERPKTINALIGDCAARIGLDKQDGPARIVGPDL
jgi:hypothetical protein